MGEWGQQAAAQDAPELPALVQPPVDDGGAEVRRQAPAATAQRRPSGRGLGGRGCRRAAGMASLPYESRSSSEAVQKHDERFLLTTFSSMWLLCRSLDG